MVQAATLAHSHLTLLQSHDQRRPLRRNECHASAGDIVTIEPGLYFPDRDLCVRIEDTFVVESDGVRTLCRGKTMLEP